MGESYGYKNILSVMDWFSHKAMIYDTNTKKSEEMLKFIKDFCINNIIPKVFISDYRCKFKNSLFNKFFEEYSPVFILVLTNLILILKI